MAGEVEISDYPGKKYSSIRIPAEKFVGLIDWSPDRKFGLAVGNRVGAGAQSAIFFEFGMAKWAIEVCNPCDIHICNEGVGVFLDSPSPGEIPQLWVFHREGILFSANYPGIGALKSVSVSPQGILVESDRRKLLYSMSGSLLSEEKFAPPRRKRK